MSAIGITMANLDGAQFAFNSLLLKHPFYTRAELTSRIYKYYYMQAIREVRYPWSTIYLSIFLSLLTCISSHSVLLPVLSIQLYKLVGSFDILGNPLSLFSNLGNGVYDFFYEPAQGLVRSPKDFGKGLAKGTTSLVMNSIYGVFNTASKITASVGKGQHYLLFEYIRITYIVLILGYCIDYYSSPCHSYCFQLGLATLSMDEVYYRERELALRRDKPTYVGEGIALGIRDLGFGVYKGITGFIVSILPSLPPFLVRTNI